MRTAWAGSDRQYQLRTPCLVARLRKLVGLRVCDQELIISRVAFSMKICILNHYHTATHSLLASTWSKVSNNETYDHLTKNVVDWLKQARPALPTLTPEWSAMRTFSLLWAERTCLFSSFRLRVTELCNGINFTKKMLCYIEYVIAVQLLRQVISLPSCCSTAARRAHGCDRTA